MSLENVAVAVCNGAAEGEAVVAELRQQGLEPDCISVVAADERGGAMPVAYYSEGGRLRGTGASAGSRSLLESLPGCVVLVSPGEPTVLLAGPFAACVVRTLDNEELFGALGPIAAGLYSLGISREAAREYELIAMRGRPLVIVQGRAWDVQRARGIMATRIEGKGQPTR